jgi:hypothetical protein
MTGIILGLLALPAIIVVWAFAIGCASLVYSLIKEARK